MGCRFYWLKLKDSFFQQKAIKKLRRIPGGDTYTIIYLKMMLKSLGNNGVLLYEHIEDDFIEELALDLDEDTDTVKTTVDFLEHNGLLIKQDDDSYLLPEAASSIGSEGLSAERMRNLRARKKSHCDASLSQCDEGVTDALRNGDVEKREKRKEIRDKRKEIRMVADAPCDEENPKGRKSRELSPFEQVEDAALREALLEYRDMRKQIKARMTVKAEQLALSKLRQLTHDLGEAVEIVNQSIMNSWKGLFPLKQERVQNLTAVNPQVNAINDFLSQVEVVEDEAD